MRFSHTFWSTFKGSFYNPSLYAEVVSGRTPSTVLFVLMLCFIYEVLIVLTVSIVAIPAFIHFSPYEFIESAYPSGLVITIDGGVASSNVMEPYMIPVPHTADSKPGDYKNILVIDTLRQVSVDDVAAYDSMMILTEKSLIVRESKDKTQIVPLKDMSLTISKEQVMEWAKNVVPTLKMAIIPLVFMVLIFMSPLMLLSYMLIALFWALATLIVAHVRGYPLRYKQAFRVSMLALGPVAALSFVETLLGFTAPPFTTFLIFLFTVWVNLQPAKPEAVESGDITF